MLRLRPNVPLGFLSALLVCAAATALFGQSPTLETRLLQEGPTALARAARENGDAARGAVVFHQAHTTCSKCHRVDDAAGAQSGMLGANLTKFELKPTDKQLVESVLEPSETIREEFRAVKVQTTDGRTITGLIVKETAEVLTLRDLAQDGKHVAIPIDEIDARAVSSQSPMPSGLVNQLTSRQQFLDLARYLFEIRDGGAARARELQPPPSLLAVQIPEYEAHVDHAGIIASLDDKAFARGREIYQRLCINCHGTREQPGSLPTSLRFAEGKFKNGNDPHAMYQTLTRGFGLMAPQTWMVPQQKYDVIHYIRTEYLRKHNPSQLFAIDEKYIAALPKGDTRGPAPRKIEPWATMDYGPVLVNTYEIGNDGSNFAYKGIAVRLDSGPGGISRGRSWMVFDHDTMRVAAAWTGTGFIDWQGIHFNGQHQVHPRIVGDVHFANPTGPGWANPQTGSFADDQRVVGRDGRRYGPLPRAWAKYKGLYYHNDRAVIAYSVGKTDVLEMPGEWMADESAGAALASVKAGDGSAEKPTDRGSEGIFTRAMNIGPRSADMKLLVATLDDASPSLDELAGGVRFGTAAAGTEKPATEKREVRFDGGGYAEVADADADAFDMTGHDFTITARVKTKAGGTIFAKAKPDSPWTPDGKTFFVRGGRLCYDIGWVGAVQSKQRVDDGRWHDVALRWSTDAGRAELFVDGKAAGDGVLRPKQAVSGHVVRVGYTAENFPTPQSAFDGQLSDVRFLQRAATDKEIASASSIDQDDRLVARWKLDAIDVQGQVRNEAGKHHAAKWIVGANTRRANTAPLFAGLTTPIPGSQWKAEGNRLCLHIPAGKEPLRFVLWTTRGENADVVAAWTAGLAAAEKSPDLAAYTSGGPPRWPQKLTTQAILGDDSGPFAVDVLVHPEVNPWLAQTRLTGLDFIDDGEVEGGDGRADRAVVCAWDGDVWIVSGLAKLDAAKPSSDHTLTWQRIASGLFQPLGIKMYQGRIYVTCRDQLVVLHDKNADGEIDFFECFNNDHQVTDHFHEFAMGLQVDAEGNFYYAKSARHALPALVPHHGTLLRVSHDGQRTDIIANGFRAANGVCLNPDGTFVVTDQEGHWNPKNRINWVTPGGFYGNMFGYHDVTDSSDEAMQQPLCWITNTFDRSPAELLWTPKDAWGPLGGSLLNLSYGYGKVYVVPFDEVGGQKQGGMCALPIGAMPNNSLPTGVMRGRFHPVDRQLYACGMMAWGSNARQPGGLYRIRYTGKPMVLPVGLRARRENIEITFTDPLDTDAAVDRDRYKIKTWSLKRSANYGSQHYDEKPLAIESATLSDDGRTIRLHAPELKPTWGMEIVLRIKGRDGEEAERVVHNSIFKLGE
ncbi:MAG: DUF6797 domain-containing protein [Pirellulales bacterium]